MNLLRIASIATLLAGVSHVTLQAYSHFGMHFYFISFLAIGLTQISLGYLLWKNKLTNSIFWITTFVNGTATVFWLLTRTMSAPFIGGVEHFSVLGVIVVSLQLISILLLCVERKNILFLIYISLGSTALGFASHFGAMQLEHHVPQLKGTGGHHGGESHSKMSAEEHSKMMNNHENKSEESTETSKSKKAESEIEIPLETETKAKVKRDIQVDEDNHDKPHGH